MMRNKVLDRIGFGTATFLVLACSKQQEPTQDQSQQGTGHDQAAATQAAAGQAAVTQDTPTELSEPETTGGATATAVPEEAPTNTVADCGNDAHWEALTLKALKTGTLQQPKEGLGLAPLVWRACSGVPGCEELSLTDSQSVLAVGAKGNELRIALKDSCPDGQQTVSVNVMGGDTPLTLRGDRIVFETAVLGGDRALFGAFAKHESARSRDGYVKREYLFTRRDYGEQQVEVARNKQQFVPHTVSSQLVHVRNTTQCTGLFWKLGIEQCDFQGPGTDVLAMFGSHLLYADPSSGKGLAWSVKEGARELLPKLDWAVTDGVNLTWAANDTLYTAQPRWDLPELSAQPVPGKAGAKPLAVGCGRMLSAGAEAWTLRDIKKGLTWELSAARFPTQAAGDSAVMNSAVMNCDYVLFSSGRRVALKNLGKPGKVGETGAGSAPTAPSTSSAATPPTTPDTAQPGNSAAPSPSPVAPGAVAPGPKKELAPPTSAKPAP